MMLRICAVLLIGVSFYLLHRSKHRPPASCNDAVVDNVKSEEEEEDLPPASCDDAVVGNVKSEEEEEEADDGLSTTSTIDYCYSEDGDRYSEDGDEVLDDPTPTEQKNQYEIISPVLTDYEMKSLSVTHGMSRADRLHMNDWIASWKVLDKPPVEIWIDVYGYYSKHIGYGGYGVILRDQHARPIAASAKFSEFGNNFFYQVFLGIKVGVALAEGHDGGSDIHVRCNSFHVPNLFKRAHGCSVSGCKDNPTNVCMMCMHYFEFIMESDSSSVVPLITELRFKKLKLTSAWGLSAHYLAKWEKRNALLGLSAHYLAKWEKRNGLLKVGLLRSSDKIEPDDFPKALKYLIWKDAFDTSDGIFNVLGKW